MSAMKKVNIALVVAVIALGLLSGWLAYYRQEKQKLAHVIPAGSESLAPKEALLAAVLPTTAGRLTQTSSLPHLIKDTTTSTQKTSSHDPLLDDLKGAYVASNLVVRIRIEDQLSRVWETNPPTVETLLHEIRDNQAPAEYRIYFAKVLANRVKMQAYAEAEVIRAFAEIRSIIGGGLDALAFKADLANILTSVDHSGDAVKAIAPLLQTPEDETAVKTVAALCRSTNSMAVQTVYEFVQTDDLFKTKPLALLAALGPLSTTTNDVAPIINRIIQQTADFRVFAGSVQCLMSAPSSNEILESIADAACASSRFPQNAHAISTLCRNAVRRHIKYFEEHKEQLDSQIVIAIEKLLRSEDGE